MEDLVYSPEQVPRYFQNVYLHLRPFYNTTRSFVGVHRLNGTLECGRPHEVLVDYYIDPTDANPDQEVVFSYYMRLGNEDCGSVSGRKGNGKCKRERVVGLPRVDNASHVGNFKNFGATKKKINM